jgi:hypothetical protein
LKADSEGGYRDDEPVLQLAAIAAGGGVGAAVANDGLGATEPARSYFAQTAAAFPGSGSTSLCFVAMAVWLSSAPHCP